jgi:hypothetical protein
LPVLPSHNRKNTVSSTEAMDSFIVHCAVERPPYFAVPVVFSCHPSRSGGSALVSAVVCAVVFPSTHPTFRHPERSRSQHHRDLRSRRTPSEPNSRKRHNLLATLNFCCCPFIYHPVGIGFCHCLSTTTNSVISAFSHSCLKTERLGFEMQYCPYFCASFKNISVGAM